MLKIESKFIWTSDKWEINLTEAAWVLKNPLGPVECQREGLSQGIQMMKHAAHANCNDNLQISLSNYSFR